MSDRGDALSAKRYGRAGGTESLPEGLVRGSYDERLRKTDLSLFIPLASRCDNDFAVQIV